MGLFGSGSKEVKSQLHFYDNGDFEFRKRPLQDAHLVEQAEGIVVKAFPLFYASEIQFNGHKGIPADMMSLSFDRDMILDPFGKVPVRENISGKPGTDEVSIGKWLAKIAESQRYKVMVKQGSLLLIEKITLFLGIGLILEIIGLVITAASRKG